MNDKDKELFEKLNNDKTMERLTDAIYLMSFDPQRYTTKTGMILVTEVKNFLEDYYIKKES